MAAFEDLLRQIGDVRLRERIAQEYDHATRDKKFGLVFQRHLPEVVPIYSATPRRGDLVAKRSGSLADTWRIKRISGGMASLVKPRLAGEKESTADRVILPVADLLVVKQFGDPIFPTLVPIDVVQNGPADAPWHTLIEADNYHALQLLDYLYAGKVDCIYIDPPYNTGAKDWKYNNNYVDNNDSWRHSKWLSFMERRLSIAKRIINREDGVIIVAIDEKEYAHLAALLETLFTDARIQMVSALINPAGVARAGGFSRSDEYLFFVMFGKASPQKLKLNRQWVSGKGRTHTGNIRWDLLRRSGTNAQRSHSPGCFYPIYVNPRSGVITHVGEPLPDGVRSAPIRPGEVAILPIRKDKSEGNWQWSRQTFIDRKAQGRVAIGGHAARGFTVYILKDGEFEKVRSGQFEISGHDENGALILDDKDATFVTAVPHSQWRIAEHDSTQYGTRLLSKILPNSAFPFPKSVYAVRDAIRFFVSHKPNALILDFFAGSGTTLGAVSLLNAADNSSRQCVLVTNNEVSADEANELSSKGLNPWDSEWEQAGICRSVTWPRTKFTVLGQGEGGVVLDGDYFTGRIVDSEKRRTYRHAAFLSPDDLRIPAGVTGAERTKAEKAIHKRKLAFVAMIEGLPQNSVPPGSDFVVSEDHKAAVLFDPAALEAWLDALDGNDHITDFFILAESEKQFKTIKAQVDDLLGPLLVPEEEKRPMAAGFESNVAYFKLDFLEKDRVEVGAAFREILPLLWMKAGAIGTMHVLPAGDLPDHLIPADNPFAVLLNETRIAAFRDALAGRRGLTHVFIVTDGEDAFRMMAGELRGHIAADNPGVEFVQLYRDYLVNFTINTRASDPAAGSEGAA